MRRRCVVVSFFRSANLGDLLISNGIADLACASAEVTRVDYSPEPWTHTGLDGPLVPSVRPAVGYRHLRSAASSGLARLGRRGPLPRLAPDVKAAIGRSDFLVIGGGNMMYATSSRGEPADYFQQHVAAARAHRKKVFAISLGIGPFVTQAQERATAEILAACDRVTLRDQQSLDIYSKWNPGESNATLCPDPAFLQPSLLQQPSARNVGMNLVDPLLYGMSKRDRRLLIGKYAQLAQALNSETGAHMELFSTDANDYDFIHRVAEHLDGSTCSVTRISGLSDLLGLYSNLSVVLGSRLHTLITAYTQGIPVVGLSWQPKVAAFFDLTHDLESCFHIADLPSKVDQITLRVSDKKRGRPSERQRMAPILRSIRKSCQVNAAILQEMAQ